MSSHEGIRWCLFMLWARNFTSIALLRKQGLDVCTRNKKAKYTHMYLCCLWTISLIRYIFWGCKKTFIRNSLCEVQTNQSHDISTLTCKICAKCGTWSEPPISHFCLFCHGQCQALLCRASDVVLEGKLCILEVWESMHNDTH